MKNIKTLKILRIILLIICYIAAIAIIVDLFFYELLSEKIEILLATIILIGTVTNFNVSMNIRQKQKEVERLNMGL